MANRYWVGGTASWDGTAGTKWATTSGGAGGASVPTTADDVFFDSNSGTGTVTISSGNTGALSINCTGFTGTITGTGGITVAGNITLASGMTYSHTGTVTVTGTGTLTTAGNTFSALNISGSGITVTLGDALNVSTRSITVTQGTFTTANFAVTAGNLLSSNTNSRTINLGSSTVTVSAPNGDVDLSTNTNLTFNAGTSQLNLGQNVNLAGGGQTFYNVTFTDDSLNRSNAIRNSNTFNNLTVTAPGNLNTGRFLLIDANQTVNGTLTCAGASSNRRVLVRSSSIGTSRIITAATLVADDCNFRDITIAGAAAGTSPTRAGDCGGNSGITFPAAKTVYRVGTNEYWLPIGGESNSWALTSGGAGSDSNCPLPQDTAVIDENTSLTLPMNMNAQDIGAIDASTRTTAITLSFTYTNSYYGSFALGSGVTVSGTSTSSFSGRGTMDFTSAGKTITFSINMNAPGGTLRLLDSLAMNSTAAFTHTNGTVNLNGYNLTVGTSYATASGTKNITFNGGTLVCPGSGSAAFNNAAPTGFTTTAGTGTGTISMTSASSKTFVGGGSTFNCTLNNGGAGALTVTGSNTFTTLANSVQPTSFLFTAGTTTSVTNWNISGTAGNLVTIGSATAASHTLSKTSGTVNADYLSISRSTATGGATWYAGANSTDDGNNLGWIFGGVATASFFLMLR